MTLGGSVKFNFNATSNSITGLGYVTQDFENYIILGANVMKYYMKVFDGRESSQAVVALYKKYYDEDSDVNSNEDSDSIIFDVVVIILVCIVGMSVFVFLQLIDFL